MSYFAGSLAKQASMKETPRQQNVINTQLNYAYNTSLDKQKISE